MARKRDGRVRLFTRRGFDWTERYPLISDAVAALRTALAVVDSEAVWCDGAGVAVFERLHSRAYDDQVFLYAFDLLELDGEDWRPRPLDERKAQLAKILAKPPDGIQYSEQLGGDRAAISSTRIDPDRARPGSRPRTRQLLACCGTKTRRTEAAYSGFGFSRPCTMPISRS
jgi:ATP dependent DNA ligase domain